MQSEETVKFSLFEALLSKNVPHILEKIFFFLDYESYKRCIEVSHVWHDLLTSDSLKKKGKSVFHTEILKDGVKLYKAAMEGDKAKALKLLSTGMIYVNTSYPTQDNLLTPLTVAAYNGHKDIAQLLFENGADLNKADRKGIPPLHYAVSNGKFDTVQLLLNLGAKPQLSKVANDGAYATLQVLLQAGANPNILDMNDEFPLLLAATNCHKHVVQLLLHRGADPNLSNQYGVNALHMAARFGHKDVVKQLIDAGADPNSRNIWGMTPLYKAAKGGNKDVVKLLVDIGADPNIADEEGKTPLTIAREKDELNIVNVLTGEETPAHVPVPVSIRDRIQTALISSVRRISWFLEAHPDVPMNLAWFIACMVIILICIFISL